MHVKIIVDYNDDTMPQDEYDVPFEAEMNIEEAMKRAYDVPHESGPRFSFVLKWFGDDLGYFVESINDIQGNRVSSWAIFIGQDESPAGIDEQILTPDDIVTFRYMLDRDIESSLRTQKARHYQRS